MITPILIKAEFDRINGQSGIYIAWCEAKFWDKQWSQNDKVFGQQYACTEDYYNGEKYYCIYVGESQQLCRRIFGQHLAGYQRVSTFRRKLAVSRLDNTTDENKINAALKHFIFSIEAENVPDDHDRQCKEKITGDKYQPFYDYHYNSKLQLAY